MKQEKYAVEVRDTPSGFTFRILRSDGKHTRWASYTQIAMLDGWCAATEYHVPKILALTIISAQDCLKTFAVGV